MCCVYVGQSTYIWLCVYKISIVTFMQRRALFHYTDQNHADGKNIHNVDCGGAFMLYSLVLVVIRGCERENHIEFSYDIKIYNSLRIKNCVWFLYVFFFVPSFSFWYGICVYIILSGFRCYIEIHILNRRREWENWFCGTSASTIFGDMRPVTPLIRMGCIDAEKWCT